MIKYIVIDSGSSASQLMFNDINYINNAIETSDLFKIKNPVLRIFNKIHMSGKLNKIVNLPLKRVWDKCYITEDARKHLDDIYIIVFTNVSIRKARIGYLRKLKALSNVRLVLVAVDPFIDKALCPLAVMQKIKFDLVYSFDLLDCKKYNLEYTNSLYSMCFDIQKSDKNSDLFFIGRAKDRYEDLISIAKLAHNKGLKINFLILGIKKNKQIRVPGISYLKHVKPYDEVLPMILASKCLLDIYQKGQKGLSMRAYEAVFYNKKLITNNINISQINYYRTQYMQIIDSVNEINFDFIKKNEKVDYKYIGDYSPIYFLEEVEKKLHQKNLLK